MSDLTLAESFDLVHLADAYRDAKGIAEATRIRELLFDVAEGKRPPTDALEAAKSVPAEVA